MGFGIKGYGGERGDHLSEWEKHCLTLIILNYNIFLLAVILSLPIIELLDPETKSKNSNFLLI